MSRRLTAEEEALVERYAQRGWSAHRIGRELDRSPSTIHWCKIRLGLRSTLDRRKGGYVRNGRQVRYFTPEEDAFIEALRCQRYSATKIAALATKRFEHPRTPATIHMRLTMLANVETAS